MSVRAKKELAQHFLVDENILGVIGRLAELQPDDVVLEIGPGLGVLTRYLAERVAHVHAVELDRSLEPHLPRAGNVSLHWGDGLRLDLAAYGANKLVANLPYNVATPLLVESLDRIPGLESWTVMLQREVADRLFAQPSTKSYGAVSVLVQLATERTGFHPVSREVFRPRPSVESLLMAGCVEFGLALGLRKILSICEPWHVARNEKLGWTLRLLGPPQSINGIPCVAIEKYVSEAVWMGICLKESVPGSVLIWKGVARPSYRLPELIPTVA